jgi:hypothetical protein
MTVTEHIYGMGLIFAPMEGLRYVLNVVGTTPVDEDHSYVFISTFVSCPPDADRAQPDKLAHAIYRAQREEVIGTNGLGDRKIWEHQRYVAHPPLPPEEHEAVRAVRDWTRQFYHATDSHV